jgi:ribosomal protein S18 acetylase RimI-like enzyme
MTLFRPDIDESDISDMRSLLWQPGNELDIVDFDEQIALESIQADLCIWRDPDGHPVAFAFVDDFNNFRFALDESYRSGALERELVDWGVTCIRRRKLETGEPATLDACCSANDPIRIAFLERNGFHPESVRTLQYERSLLTSIPPASVPEGFCMRSVKAEDQAERLVALHRAAFGTEHMTLEYRLAMMRLPNYDPGLDLFIEGANGEPVAFCICSIAVEENERLGTKIGCTDPVGVDPRYRGQGFGKAVLAAGLHALVNKRMECAKLGTSSENISMQRLAEALGFQLVSEKIWFSMDVR